MDCSWRKNENLWETLAEKYPLAQFFTGEAIPPKLYQQNSLLCAPKQQDTHSLGVFFVNTGTIP